MAEAGQRRIRGPDLGDRSLDDLRGFCKKLLSFDVEMAFTLGSLFEACLLLINAVAILHEERFLVKSKHRLQSCLLFVSSLPAWREGEFGLAVLLLGQSQVVKSSALYLDVPTTA